MPVEDVSVCTFALSANVYVDLALLKSNFIHTLLSFTCCPCLAPKGIAMQLQQKKMNNQCQQAMLLRTRSKAAA